MNRPIIFFNSRQEIIRREITLPSGKKIVLSRECTTYKTDNPEEIEFMSKLAYIGAREVDDKEYVIYLTSKYSDMPNVDRVGLTNEDLEQYMANTETEKMIVDKLREKGYTIEAKAESAAKLIGIPVPEKPVIQVKPKLTKPNPRAKKSDPKK